MWVVVGEEGLEDVLLGVGEGGGGAEEDDALFVALRDAYRAGIVTSYAEADVQAATETFALLAKYGGADAIGDKPDLAPGTFWTGYSK